jgi:predicted SAM-dependent methyltransferase
LLAEGEDMNETNYDKQMLGRFKDLEASRVTGKLQDWGWRLFGVVGNSFYRKTPPAIRHSSGKRYMNMGCGKRHAKGFVNADFYRFHEKLLPSRTGPDWMLDITRKFNCPSNHWNGVFMEHTNEHLSYTENYYMLTELHRTMVPGGRLRLVVPDLDRYLQFKLLQTDFVKFQRYHSLPEAVSNLTQGHGHRSVWNAELLVEVLSEIGFATVQEMTFREGGEQDLLLDTDSRRWESFYVEGVKLLAPTDT